MPLSKGQTNNPHGRPRKDKSLTETLAKYGNKKVSGLGSEYDGLKLKEALAKRLWQLAIHNKDIHAMKYIFDRIDGKPINMVITNTDRGDLQIIKTLQKELFEESEMEGIQDEGTLEPPEEAGAGAGE